MAGRGQLASAGMADPARPEPRRVLGSRYELRRPLAVGTVAEVWRAWDRVQRREVAIKVLAPDLRRDPEVNRRFKREVVASVALNHPNVVRTQEALTEGSGIFMVMDLVDGSTLRQLLEGTYVLGPRRAVRIAGQVAAALDHAHGKGVLHRDLKPENVLVDLDDEVKVADFGISRAFEKPEDQGRDMIETARVDGPATYLPPERIQGLPVDARSDLYTLGVLLYEMLCGHPPFTGTNAIAVALQHVTTPPTRPRIIQPGIPKPVEQIVMRALAKSPEDRFATAAEMIEALDSLDLGPDDALPLVVRDPTPPRGVPRVGRPQPAGRRERVPRPQPSRNPAGRDRPPSGVGRLPRPPVGAVPPPSVPDPWRRPEAPPQRPPVRTSSYTGAEYWAPRAPEPPPRRRRAWLGPLILLVVVLVVVAVAGVLVSTTDTGRELLDDILGRDVTPTSLPVVGAFASFDPPPGNGSENDAELASLNDGDPQTSWITSNYPVGPGLGGVKPGVGLVWQAASPVTFELLSVSSPDAGWTFEVYVGTRAWQTLTGWGAPIGDRFTVSTNPTQVDLDGARGSALLIWITSVGPRGLVELEEVQVVSEGGQ